MKLGIAKVHAIIVLRSRIDLIQHYGLNVELVSQLLQLNPLLHALLSKKGILLADEIVLLEELKLHLGVAVNSRFELGSRILGAGVLGSLVRRPRVHAGVPLSLRHVCLSNKPLDHLAQTRLVEKSVVLCSEVLAPLMGVHLHHLRHFESWRLNWFLSKEVNLTLTTINTAGSLVVFMPLWDRLLQRLRLHK